MKLLNRLMSFAAIVLLCACSGPPNIQLPDRPAELQGIIVSVDVSRESIDIVDLDVETTGGDKHVRKVKVDHETVILTPGNAYPQTAAALQKGRFVRIWLHQAIASSSALPIAEYIEIKADPGVTPTNILSVPVITIQASTHRRPTHA